MDTESTRALVRRFVEARAANDADALAELLADDAEWHAPASVGIGPFVGREAVARALSGGASASVLDPATVQRDVRSLIADGDRAVVQQRLTATARNGNDYANEYCWVYTCRDGRVQLLEEYADTLYASKTLRPTAR